RAWQRGTRGLVWRAWWPIRSLAGVAAERALASPARSLKLTAIGTTAGLFSGLFGVGGGTVIVPLLVLWLAYDERVATGTSLAGGRRRGAVRAGAGGVHEPQPAPRGGDLAARDHPGRPRRRLQAGPLRERAAHRRAAARLPLDRGRRRGRGARERALGRGAARLV